MTLEIFRKWPESYENELEVMKMTRNLQKVAKSYKKLRKAALEFDQGHRSNS